LITYKQDSSIATRIASNIGGSILQVMYTIVHRMVQT